MKELLILKFKGEKKMYKDLYLNYLYNIRNILKDSDISVKKIEMYEKVIELSLIHI